MPSYLLYFALFLSCLTFLFSLYIYKLGKNKEKEEIEEASISGQRERIERHLYEWREIMQNSPERFFDTNKLLLQSAEKNLLVDDHVPNYSYFTNQGIDIGHVEVKERTALCLMPFNKSFQKTYSIITDVCRKNNVTCFRSDEPYNPGNLLRQILTQMLEAQFIIAVLDGQNPNVFYEIGIAHSIGKVVILLANLNQKDDIPFDLSSDRLLLYSNNFELRKQLTKVISNLHYVNG